MRILAIEQSTPTGSLALLDGDRVLAQRSWTEPRARSPQLFARLPACVREAGVNPAEIELFAAGLGPGSFAGIRTSVAALRGLALPGGRIVTGVSSAEAIACDVFRERGPQSVAVVGDARRRRLWFVRFRPDDDGRLSPEQPLQLLSPGELAAYLPAEGTLVASPDWERLEESLRRAAPPAALLPEPRLPRAATVGRQAGRILSATGSAPPPAPIYLHPPVFEPVRPPPSR